MYSDRSARPRSSASASRAWTTATLDGFQDVGPAWDEAVARMRRPTPFLLHGWLTAWWRVFEADTDVRVHARYDGDRIVAALPLRIDWDRCGLSKASILGSAMAPLADMVLDARAEPAVAAETLDRGLLDVGILDMFPLPPESPILDYARCGAPSTVLQSARSPVFELDGDWDTAYRATHSNRRRALHRRRRRQLSSLGSLDVDIAKTPGDLMVALDEALAIHALRWRGRGDVTHFSSAESRRFHRAAIASLGESQVIRLLLLEVGGKAVAFVYFFVFAGRMYIYRLAFDPSVGRYSPGTIAVLEAIRSAIGEGVQTIEFLRGMDEYKLAWANRIDRLERALLSTTRPHQLAGEAISREARARRRIQKLRGEARRAYRARRRAAA